MPLPEGISELSFAGVLAGRRFRYAKKDGYTISTDADFVIWTAVWRQWDVPDLAGTRHSDKEHILVTV